jgi:hypothetical protein
LRNLLAEGLAATAELWPPIARMYGWVHRAAHHLGEVELQGKTIRRKLAGVLGVMARRRGELGPLSRAADHFLKVSRSYWAGLFACYDAADLPRTNNDLEQFFGRGRYHERRATGRRGASPGLVLRGSARLLAGAATRLRRFTAADCATADPIRLHTLRAELEARRQRRVQRHRFRRDPEKYLRELEERLIQSALPS